MTEKQKKILWRLQAQCVRREYCRSDMQRKIKLALERASEDPGVADQMLDSLLQDGFVDDLRYASAFAREKAALTGWGSAKIRYALAAKRIPAEVVAQALEEIDPARSDDRLHRLIQVKRKSLGNDPQARVKLLKYALSRGYDYDSVRQFVDDPDD